MNGTCSRCLVMRKLILTTLQFVSVEYNSFLDMHATYLLH